MSHIVEWFFGRGLSIGCGLRWAVPQDWLELDRGEQITRIKATLVTEMAAPHVDVSDIQFFLEWLDSHTVSTWKHRFHTTNWDYLLQREILAKRWTRLPRWCANSHVFHLNGTVEELPDNSRRSPIVLESDTGSARQHSLEGDMAFNHFIWSKTFVVVGMSFECEVDKFLLSALNRVEDDLPIGDSYWIVLNPDAAVLAATCGRIRTALPGATVVSCPLTFRAWLDSGAGELISRGIITS